MVPTSQATRRSTDVDGCNSRKLTPCRRSRSRSLVPLLFIACSLPAQGDPPNAHTNHGINLPGIVDWSTAWTFTDAFRTAREWIPQRPSGGPWNTGEKLTLDPNGWPLLKSNQAAGTLMFRDTGPHYPAGRYLCLYTGDGDIEFRFDAKVANQQPGRIELDVKPTNGGIYLKIVRSNTSNPVRDIKVILPGFHQTWQTQTFHPLFLERLAEFRVLRFMDWQRTNNSPNRTWADRPRLTEYSQATDKGVAPELMLELCNELHADPWFCMPHEATDTFVREFARLVKTNLAPKRKVYIEYSNETWNGTFGQAIYCQKKGLAQNLSTNSFQAQLYYTSKRAVEMFGIWETVYGSKASLVRVLACQSANPWAGEQVMDFRNAHQHADAYAVAPYFGNPLGSSRAAQTVLMTPSQVIAECDLLIDSVAMTTKRNQQNASQRGLDLLAYEGGQHLVGVGIWQNNPTLTSLLIATNRDAGMAALYKKDLAGWVRNGGGLFCSFSFCNSPSKYGSWGALEYMDQPVANAPKYRAILDHIQEQKPVRPFGDSCGNVRAGSVGRPVLGNSTFAVVVEAPRLPSSALFLIGASSTAWTGGVLPFDLVLLGASGCFLNVSMDVMLYTSPSGTGATLTLPIPTNPALSGVIVFGQWVLGMPGANSLGVQTSNGLRIRIER